jgi:hypothetical protein
MVMSSVNYCHLGQWLGIQASTGQNVCFRQCSGFDYYDNCAGIYKPPEHIFERLLLNYPQSRQFIRKEYAVLQFHNASERIINQFQVPVQICVLDIWPTQCQV